VPWSSVGGTLLVIGVVWTGGVFLLGYLAFRRKELAVYSGGS
jgi:type IV secretory pathway VirB2 component (pilin)